MVDLTKIKTPDERIKAWREGPVGWLMLDRPERANALDTKMWQALSAAVRLLDNDPVRVIVIRGQGDAAFAAGADISEFGTTRSDAEAARAYEALNVEAFSAIAGVKVPVIAMISGYCLGGGLAVALCCDIRLAGDNAVFALPPARLGLAYPVEGLRQLLAAVSPAVAKEMIFTARRLNALEAMRCGLVNDVVAQTQLEETVREMALAIAGNAPLTIRASKQAIDELSRRPQDPDIARLEKLSGECFDSDDYAEGQAAFLEKRQPVFKGR